MRTNSVFHNYVRPDTTDSYAVAPFSLYALISDALGPYYRYSGSLTTPHCQESAVWTVYERTLFISSSQVINQQSRTASLVYAWFNY